MGLLRRDLSSAPALLARIQHKGVVWWQLLLAMLSPVDYEDRSHALDGIDAATRLTQTNKITCTTTATAIKA
jgi:hypothetical protein